MITKANMNFTTSSPEWDAGTLTWTLTSDTFGFPMAGSPHIYQVSNTDQTYSGSDWVVKGKLYGAAGYAQLTSAAPANKVFSIGGGNAPTGCARLVLDGISVTLPATGTETLNVLVYLLEVTDA